MRTDQVIFKNHPRHIEVPRDVDMHLYAFNGNLWTRIGYGTPKLVSGIVVNQVSGGGSAIQTRSGRVTLNTETYIVVFDTPLGVTGEDYNLFFDVYDIDGATPSYQTSNRTKYGFTVTVYDNNINFGWKAELNTQ